MIHCRHFIIKSIVEATGFQIIFSNGEKLDMLLVHGARGENVRAKITYADKYRNLSLISR